MKVFLDTNVLIAASVEDHEYHSRALPLMQSVHDGRNQGFVSAHSLLEMYAILTRLPRSPRILPIQAEALVRENVASRFTVVALTAKEYATLVKRFGGEEVVGGQAYDALHLECANKSGADRIYTFNVRHFAMLASHLASKITAP
ncbi:MAG: PIN domain-containing protein [Acidobacteria bacterium]|nr:MAG: PIN domain-containing protein [Acidobacteriota bacterium]